MTFAYADFGSHPRHGLCLELERSGQPPEPPQISEREDNLDRGAIVPGQLQLEEGGFANFGISFISIGYYFINLMLISQERFNPEYSLKAEYSVLFVKFCQKRFPTWSDAN